MSKIPGVADVALSTVPGKPELQFTADRSKASVYGLTSTTVGNAIRTLVSGSNASVYNDPGKEANIVVRLRPEDRTRVDDILGLTLATPSGQIVPLRNLVSTANGSGPSVITRLNRQTQIIVGANIVGRTQADVLTDLRPVLTQMQPKFPSGVTWQFGGQIQNTQDALNTLFFSFALSLIFMYIVLASQFGSFTQPIVLMLALPFAFTGAFAALLLTKTGGDMTALIGMMLLMGLAVKNSILLVDFTNRLRAQGMNRTEALLTAGPVRLRPVLMTSMALILGMLPVSLGLGAGGSFRAPMAIGVIGGLVTSTILTLLFVPVAYSVLDITLGWIKSIRAPSISVGRKSDLPKRSIWARLMPSRSRPTEPVSLGASESEDL
jgi:HAE1 family hydrophobic/amphiphilic exporter-1